MIIKSIYKGEHGSCGYGLGYEYKLILTHTKKEYIFIEQTNGEGLCVYATIITFLQNWSDIKVISK